MYLVWNLFFHLFSFLVLLSLLYNVEALSAFTSDKRQVGNTCVPDQYIAETQTESIEWFMEDQAFLLSYDSAPGPPPSPSLPSANFLSSSVFPCVAGKAYWCGGWSERGAKSHNCEKAWSPINNSILSATGDFCLCVKKIITIAASPASVQKIPLQNK